jgi:hypothetical protein
MVLYTPDYVIVESQDSTYFDGSQSSTGEAEMKELSGEFNARVYLERSNDEGESWEEVSQYDTGSLSGSWQTKAIQPILKKDTRRLRVDNADTRDGLVEAIGEEL